jgi:HlyD family secretion protein
MAKKKSKKKLIIWLSIISVIIISIVAGVVMKGKPQPLSVTIAKVEKKTLTQTVTANGKIEAETEVKISSETSGEITALNIKEGDSVRKSSLLARIKPDIIESQLDQFKAASEASKMDIEIQKAELERSKSDLARISDLYKKEYVSKQDFDKAKTAYQVAESQYQASLQRFNQSKASLSQIEKSLARTTIYSPIAGIVTKLSVELGEKVVGTAQMQGTEMMKISNLNVMNAMVDVDENDIVNVKIGDSATVKVDALPNKELRGVVIEIGHSATASATGSSDQVTNFKVKIRIVDYENKLRPGMSCESEIKTQTKENVLSVPLQAVTMRESSSQAEAKATEEKDMPNNADDEKNKKSVKMQQVVFVKDGNKVKMAVVKTGISEKGNIEILEGVTEGQEIVSGSFSIVSKLLQDGSDIKIDSLKIKTKKD